MVHWNGGTILPLIADGLKDVLLDLPPLAGEKGVSRYLLRI